ncbi:hypothetical protein NTE19_003318 [Vibrio fluvialis]|nr:hypothetical protein [Vibrio fluvialis]
MSNLSKETEDRLYRNLIKLGDMMGDGLHLEPDGKWISREYSKTLKALGIKAPSKPRRNNSARINERMAERVKEVKCGKCNGELKQTRSGAKRAICLGCGTKWVLLK